VYGEYIGRKLDNVFIEQPADVFRTSTACLNTCGNAGR
jgi:hypothetical protein